MTVTASAAVPPAKIRKFWPLVRDTVSSFFEDKALRLAAALALYTILSLAPLMVISIKLLTVAVPGNPETSHRYVEEQMTHLVGNDGARAIADMISNSKATGAGFWAAIVSGFILLLTASGVFSELQDALNTVWEVKPKPNLPWWSMVRQRLFSVAMVFVIAFLLLMSMIVTAALGTFINRLSGEQNSARVAVEAKKVEANARTQAEADAAAKVAQDAAIKQKEQEKKGWFAKTIAYVVDFVVSLAVMTLLFMAIFRVLPDVKIAWRDVWIGAAVTGVLFKIGQILLALYFTYGTSTSAYGAAGSLVAVLLWAYYSSAILFMGAEFTQVYAHAQGRKIVPDEHAVPVTEEERAQQGMPSPDNVLAASEGLPPPVAPDSTSYPTEQKKPTYLYPPAPYAPAYHRPNLGRGALLTLGGLAAGAAGAWVAANRRGPAMQARLTADAIGRRIHDIESRVGGHSRLKRLGAELRVHERVRLAEKRIVDAERAMRRKGHTSLLERLKDWMPA